MTRIHVGRILTRPNCFEWVCTYRSPTVKPVESKRSTIADVAKLANVSKATVSAVVNGTGVVRESTRERVRDAITELNYRSGLALR